MINYRVDIFTSLNHKEAHIYIGDSEQPQFVIIPNSVYSVTVAKIIERSTIIKYIWVDREGYLVYATGDVKEGDNYGWLLDLAMEHGLEYVNQPDG